MGKVVNYLDAEKQDILSFCKTEAENRLTGVGTFKDKMYTEWASYFDNLIATTDRILDDNNPWDRGDFRQAIKSERHALEKVIDEIDDLIPEYSIATGRQLGTLGQLLLVESQTGNVLRKKADKDYK